MIQHRSMAGRSISGSRTPDDPQQPFDLHELPDHPTYESAKGAARALALQLLGDAEAWNHD